jgi:hypothetical protein
VVSDVAVYLRGSAELVSAMDVPDELRRQGLAREAAAGYRLIVESQAGSELADHASFKEGITWSELGEWDRAAAAWQSIRGPRLAEEAAILSLQPLIKQDPERLIEEFAQRWFAASPSGREALIRLWISAANIFESPRGAFSEDLVERYFELRRQFFPNAAHADPATLQVGLHTGRFRLAEALIVNRPLRGKLLGRLGDVEGERRMVGSNSHALPEHRRRHDLILPRRPVTTSLPEWLARVMGGEAETERQALLATYDMEKVHIIDRLVGDPHTLLDQATIETTLINSLWLHALESGDDHQASRWERQNRRRDPDRVKENRWVASWIEPICIIASQGRRGEAQQLVETLCREPRSSWGGAATIWGEALSGRETQPLPGIVHAELLLAAMRAELAADPTTPTLWRRWFDEALPSYSITSLSLLRLAWWRMRFHKP